MDAFVTHRLLINESDKSKTFATLCSFHYAVTKVFENCNGVVYCDVDLREAVLMGHRQTFAPSRYYSKLLKTTICQER